MASEHHEHRTKPTDVGLNRTGLAASPSDGRRLIEGAEESSPDAGVDGRLIAAERLAWARGAEPVGTMPPLRTTPGLFKPAVEVIEGYKPMVLLDKLGERLAYERTGTRLYQALIAKFEAASVHQGGPTLVQLQQLCDDELRHFAIVRDAIERMGADPTAMTPCADITVVASVGFIQVLTDPRTTLTQCLDVMLGVELLDVDGWGLLATLAQGLGFDELSEQFRLALIEEEQHAVLLRQWVGSAVFGQAGVAPTPPQHPGASPGQPAR